MRPPALSPLTPQSSHNLEESAAPQLLGPVWNWFLYGVLVVQFYVYSYNFPQDSRRTKLLVCIVFFLETAQTALSGADLYYWFVISFGKTDHLFSSFLSFLDVPIMGFVVALIVQFFFVYRILVLSERRWWWLCVIIGLLSIIGAFGALFAGLAAYAFGIIRSEGFQIFGKMWLIANTLSDLLIASAMLYHLRRIWARDSSLSDHVLMSIVRLIVETNLATTTVSVTSLLMLFLYPDKNWYVCPTYVLGKLYSNTLLVSLNNRILIRDAYDARGGVIDCQDVAGPSISNNSRLEFTTETAIAETEKPRKDLTDQPVVETEVGENIL